MKFFKSPEFLDANSLKNLNDAIKSENVGMQKDMPNKLQHQDSIDTIGNCANCGVEFHIHKPEQDCVHPFKDCVMSDRLNINGTPTIKCTLCGNDNIMNEKVETDKLKSIQDFLMSIADELNLNADFSDATFDGSKEAPYDEIGLIALLLHGYKTFGKK